MCQKTPDLWVSGNNCDYNMEPSLPSETSIMLAVVFNYYMLCCVFRKWYAKVNGRLNCPVILK